MQFNLTIHFNLTFQFNSEPKESGASLTFDLRNVCFLLIRIELGRRIESARRVDVNVQIEYYIISHIRILFFLKARAWAGQIKHTTRIEKGGDIRWLQINPLGMTRSDGSCGKTYMLMTKISF